MDLFMSAGFVFTVLVKLSASQVVKDGNEINLDLFMSVVLFMVLVKVSAIQKYQYNISTAAVLAQSVERVDCRAGGRGLDSRGRTNTQGLKITEK